MEDELLAKIVEILPPQEPDPDQEQPVPLSSSIAAIERLLRPDLAGILDNPFGIQAPKPTTRKALQAARLSPNFIRTAGILAVKGFSDQEIAEAFGVGLAEVKTWEREYPDFKETLSRCKDVQDAMVERSLFNIATGYSHPAVDIKVDKDGITYRTPYIEHIPPNLGACKEWLHNRQPERWRPVGSDGDGMGGSGQAGAGGRAAGVTVVLYSPHAQAQAVSIQAGQGNLGEGGRDIGGYGARTHGGCLSVAQEQEGGGQKNIKTQFSDNPNNTLHQNAQANSPIIDADYSPFNDPDYPPVNTIGGCPKK